MKTDPSKSKFHEREDANQEWDFDELVHLRAILRRLRFLEANIEKHSRSGDTSVSAMFTEREASALKWLLDDIGYLEVKN